MQRHIAYLSPTTSIEPQNQNTKPQFPTHFRHVTITNKPYDIVHVQPWSGILERNLRCRSTRNLSIARVVNPKPIPKNLDKLPSFNPPALLCHNRKSHSLHLAFAFVQDTTSIFDRSELLDEPLFWAEKWPTWQCIPSATISAKSSSVSSSNMTARWCKSSSESS